jgi:oxygen-independent coproporphyrinogen-3 oxidase
MQQDGLLKISADQLEVQPAGRLLVRNIGMVFDRYLKESGTSFSRVI